MISVYNFYQNPNCFLFCVEKVLIFLKNNDIIILPNKLNIQGGCIFHLGILIPFFDNTLFVEFDKMQIPYRESCNIPNLYIVCLATTGVCVFVR